LAERGYDCDGELTIELAPDPLAPWNEGRFTLECSRSEARVATSRGNADLTLTSKALASLYSGYRSPRQLVAWGLAAANDAAIAHATRIFATRHAPHCPDNF
jgi:predicted acetyltransferase